MSSRIAVAALLVALVASCGDETGSSGTAVTTSSSPRMGLEETAEMMQALVDETVAVVFTTSPTALEDGIGRESCGSETNEERVDYGLSIAVAADEIDTMISQVGERWAALGAHDERPGDGLSYEFEGYGVGLTPFRDEERVTIGGATDCFAPG